MHAVWKLHMPRHDSARGDARRTNEKAEDIEMNKSIIALLVVIAALFGGYKWYEGNQAKINAEQAAAEAKAVEDAAAEAAAKAEAEAAAAAAAATEAAEQAAAEAAAAAEQAATEAAEAAEAATDAATDAVEGATDAVEGAMEAVSDAVEGVVGDSATDADAAGGAATDALTKQGFDATKVNEMIDSSSLGDAEKAGLKAAVEAAASNPALLDAAINQVKAALGM